jgi:choice-of-anchor B domain-containing protein
MDSARSFRLLVLSLALVSCGGDGGGDGQDEPGLHKRSSLDLAALGAPGGNCAGNWGYTAPGGRRFALTGTSAGLSIVEVSDLKNPRKIALIEGPANLWREVKTYRNYVYVTTEASHGLDIVDLSDPDRPRKVRTWNRTFTSAHTLWIDEARGLLFANGTRRGGFESGGMRVLDLNANPEDPTDLGGFADYYIHDSYVRGTTLYASAIFDGFIGILDVSNPRAIREITRFTTGGQFTHNSWLTDEGRFLFTTDEIAGRPLEGWDLNDRLRPRKVSEYISAPGTLPHNVTIDGDRLVVAHYAEGVHILDISDPARPQKLGSFDTFPAAACPDWLGKSGLALHHCHGEGCGGEREGPNVFCGVWGAYIFPGTDLVLGSDMQNGLFVLEYVD